MTTKRAALTPLAYRPTQVAQLLGCSREFIFKLIEKGTLKSYHIGAARFISATELKRFIREREEAE